MRVRLSIRPGTATLSHRHHVSAPSAADFANSGSHHPRRGHRQLHFVWRRDQSPVPFQQQRTHSGLPSHQYQWQGAIWRPRFNLLAAYAVGSDGLGDFPSHSSGGMRRGIRLRRCEPLLTRPGQITRVFASTRISRLHALRLCGAPLRQPLETSSRSWIVAPPSSLRRCAVTMNIHPIFRMPLERATRGAGRHREWQQLSRGFPCFLNRIEVKRPVRDARAVPTC